MSNKLLPAWWLSTLNIFWLAGTGVCCWFLFVHAPVSLSEKNSYDALLILHLIGAYSVYLACVHNTLLTPSVVGGIWHANVGRFGLIMGVMSFVCGFILTWWKIGANNLGFSIGITVGGVAQMWNQFWGYHAIQKWKRLRDETKAMEETNNDDACDTTELYKLQDDQDAALISHVGHMLSLFMLACGVPGIIRMASATNNFGLAVGLLIASAVLLSIAYAKMIFYPKIRAKRATERRGDDEQEEHVAEQET